MIYKKEVMNIFKKNDYKIHKNYNINKMLNKIFHKRFAFIELMFGLSIVGILTLVFAPTVGDSLKIKKIEEVERDVEIIERVITVFYENKENLLLIGEENEMETIFECLKAILNKFEDQEEYLYKIDLSKIDKSLRKNIKHGYGKSNKDFYVYSTKTGKVYYYDCLNDSNNTGPHNKEISKNKSLLINESIPLKSNSIINPIIELTTNLDNINPDTIIKWEYDFTDEDKNPSKISFILNDIEYNNIENIPTKLGEGSYSIKLKAQNSKGIWSNNFSKTFNVIRESNSISLEKAIFSTGRFSTMLIKNDGSLYYWGYNPLDNTMNYKDTKITFPNGVKPIAISQGDYHSIAIGNDGNLYAWGQNNYGQLGIGSNEEQLTPQLVNLPNNIKPKSIISGPYYSMAIGEDNNIYAWGNNKEGQLGVGNKSNKNKPIKVKLPIGVKPSDISLGNDFSIIIGSDGNLYGFGNNKQGQLGNGTNKSGHTYIKITLPNNLKLKSISSGFGHTIAIGEDDNLYTWGLNDYGQLGIGNTINQSTPKMIELPKGVKPISIKAGFNHSMIIGSDNNVYAFGDNTFGQLGIGNTINQLTPIKVDLPSGIIPKSIHLGFTHSMLVTDSDVYMWGQNSHGQFGDETLSTQLTPIRINQ